MKQSVSLWCRWLCVACVLGSVATFGACGVKKIGLTTGEACDANEQCLSGNCAGQGGSQTCQPAGGNKVCTPGSTQSCICTNGQAGNQTCDAAGQAWGACTCTGAPPQKCVPNSTQACTCSDGKTGNQTCNADGQAYGNCTCTGGPLCTAGSTQACLCPSGAKGSQSCNADGKSWGTCQCQSTQACTPGSTQACDCPGGTKGSQTCNADGKAWGACQGCGSTGGCTPGATQQCDCPGGTKGSQTCNANKTWGACQGCGSSTGKDFGGACSTSKECKSGICIDDPSSQPFCTKRCETTTCPNGYACTIGQANALICGKIQPNAKPFGAACQNSLDCQSLICWRNACSQRCNNAQCPGGYNCVIFIDGFNFCSTGICNPKHLQQASACAQQCNNGDNQCVADCQAKYMSNPCQSCFLALVQCASNNGCNPDVTPSCCAAQQKKCFGP